MDYRTFDVEAAKAGAPIITRDGKDAKFIAHLPECDEGVRVLALVEGGSSVGEYYEDGLYWHDGDHDADDLFMKPVAQVEGQNVYVGDSVWCEVYGECQVLGLKGFGIQVRPNSALTVVVHPSTLKLKEPKSEIWVNLYYTPSQNRVESYFTYPSEEKAKAAARAAEDQQYLGTFKFEVKE